MTTRDETHSTYSSEVIGQCLSAVYVDITIVHHRHDATRATDRRVQDAVVKATNIEDELARVDADKPHDAVLTEDSQHLRVTTVTRW